MKFTRFLSYFGAEQPNPSHRPGTVRKHVLKVKMKGKSARNKGSVGEREVARILEDCLGLKVSRQLSQTRDGGCDLKIRCARKTFNIEVKRCERIQAYKFFDQAEKSCSGGEIPIVIFRSNGKGWLFIGDISLLIYVLREEGPIDGS